MIEDFSSYIDGELGGQGNWVQMSGQVNADDTNNRCYQATTTDAVYYSTDFTLNTPKRVFYQAVVAVVSGGIIDVGVSREGYPGNIEAGLRLQGTSGYLTLYPITNDTPDGYLSYTPHSYQNVTLEFIHNWDTNLFEYISCSKPTYYGENIAGTASGFNILSHVIKPWNTTNNLISYIHVESVATQATKYLQFPKWMPTKYGMRPWY